MIEKKDNHYNLDDVGLYDEAKENEKMMRSLKEEGEILGEKKGIKKGAKQREKSIAKSMLDKKMDQKNKLQVLGKESLDNDRKKRQSL